MDLKNFPDGANNFNNIAYIKLSKQYGKDAFYVLKAYPGLYLKSVIKSFSIYFYPSNDYFALGNELNVNRKKLFYLVKFYNIVFYGQLLNIHDISFAQEYDSGENYSRSYVKIGFFLLAGYIIVLIYGIYLIAKMYMKKSMNTPYSLTLIFLFLNILYVTCVSNLFETGENNRFRFMIDPFVLVFLGLILHNGMKKIMKKSYVHRN